MREASVETSSLRVFGNIWNGCRVLAAGLTPFVLKEIFKIGLSKMQFNAFPGPELVNQKGLLRCYGKKCSQELYALHKYVSKIRVKYTLALIKKRKDLCKLPDFKCQTTERCVRCPASNETPALS